MALPRKKKVPRKQGHPRIVGPGLTTTISPLSLPPAVVGDALAASLPPDTRVACPTCGTLTKRPTCPNGHPVPQPVWRLPDDSIVREHAMAIIALRLGGLDDDEIAKIRKISRKCIAPYIYRAGKNGWLSFNSSREAIENGMAHKVIRNLDEFLDARDKDVTLEVAKGTLFKEFGPQTGDGPVQQTMIGITVVQPTVAQPMREGTIGAAPNYQPIIDVTPNALPV